MWVDDKTIMVRYKGSFWRGDKKYLMFEPVVPAEANELPKDEAARDNQPVGPAEHPDVPKLW
jgi:hypothetical protein